MDYELKTLIEKNLKLTEENNELLRKINRRQVTERFFVFVKWFLIIGISLGVLYKLEPYAQKVFDAYNIVSGVIPKIEEQKERPKQ